MSSEELFIKLDQTATLPTSDGENVYIVYSNEVQTIQRNSVGRFHCGVAVSEAVKGVIFRITPIENTAFQTGLGVVRAQPDDKEIKVFVINSSGDDITIGKGDAIGRLERFA